MSTDSCFIPAYGSNKVVTAGAASATTTVGKGNRTLLVKNTGTGIAYFRTGLAADGTVTASTADVPVAAGERMNIGKQLEHDTVAYISAAGTTLQIMAGEGGYL